jgi:hypothetical protein
MDIRQRLELFNKIKLRGLIGKILKVFPGSRVLSLEEVLSLNLQIHDEPKIEVQKTHKRPAKPGLGSGEASGFGRPVRRHERLENCVFFDLLYPKGAND